MSTTFHTPQSKTTRDQHFGSLVLFAAISLIMLALGGWLTALGRGPWYDNLKIPSWQPPGWVFVPVWTTLLTLLAISTWLVSSKASPAQVRVPLLLYGFQVLLNVAWSLLFFALHSPALALIDIVVLDVVLVLMVVTYARTSWLAAGLIVPYALWVFLATAINVWIVVNN